MTIYEAAKSGHPFRRKSGSGLWINWEYKIDRYFNREALIADDWEIKVEKIEFETEWKSVNNLAIPNLETKKEELRSFIGLKTKITVEVIDG